MLDRLHSLSARKSWRVKSRRLCGVQEFVEVNFFRFHLDHQGDSRFAKSFVSFEDLLCWFWANCKQFSARFFLSPDLFSAITSFLLRCQLNGYLCLSYLVLLCCVPGISFSPLSVFSLCSCPSCGFFSCNIPFFITPYILVS